MPPTGTAPRRRLAATGCGATSSRRRKLLSVPDCKPRWIRPQQRAESREVIGCWRCGGLGSLTQRFTSFLGGHGRIQADSKTPLVWCGRDEVLAGFRVATVFVASIAVRLQGGVPAWSCALCGLPPNLGGVPCRKLGTPQGAASAFCFQVCVGERPVPVRGAGKRHGRRDSCGKVGTTDDQGEVGPGS